MQTSATPQLHVIRRLVCLDSSSTSALGLIIGRNRTCRCPFSSPSLRSCYERVEGELLRPKNTVDARRRHFPTCEFQCSVRYGHTKHWKQNGALLERSWLTLIYILPTSSLHANICEWTQHMSSLYDQQTLTSSVWGFCFSCPISNRWEEAEIKLVHLGLPRRLQQSSSFLSTLSLAKPS